MAKVWKKLQRADSAFTGDVTGSINGASAASIKLGAAKGETANQDTTSTIRSGVTAANVGLGNVPNYSAATMRAGVTSSDVGLGNVANESRATILGGIFTGNVTGTVNGASAASIKSGAASGTSAKDAVDGNASITMVGGTLSIGTPSGGVYPFAVSSTGAIAVAGDEFVVTSAGAVSSKGDLTIGIDASNNSSLIVDGASSGTSLVKLNGGNPTVDIGSDIPLGTSTLKIRRGSTGNQGRIFFYTGSGSGSNTATLGYANQPSAYNTQFAIHNAGIYDNTSPYLERNFSMDANGRMGFWSNAKTFAGLTIGTDGTNKGLYVKDGGVGIGKTNTANGTLTVGSTGSPINGGWHSSTKIFITPADFIVNDDNNYYNIALLDNGGQLKPMTSALEAYCNFTIPDGYKAVSFRLDGTAGVAIGAYYSDVTTGTSTACGPPQALYTETQYNFYSSALASTTNGRYIILKWSPSSTSHRLYGGYIIIAPS